MLPVREGGHSVAGNSVCDGGLMLDLSGMKGLRVDPDGRTARAESGLTLESSTTGRRPAGWRRRSASCR
jgi:FAD/FMN-containing dehydrogenase